jgi:hypothetical protein
VPLLGIAFIVVLFISFIVMGEPKDADHPANEIRDWYVDNKDGAQIGAVLSALAGTLLIFYGAYLRTVLRAAGGENSMLPGLVVVGLSIVAIGAAIDGTILFATAEAAEDIPAESTQTLQALWDNDFIPIALGVLVFLWSFGLSVLRTGALPKWMGWVAIAFGIVACTPIGWVGAIGAALLILVSSILLSVRARRTPAAA